MSEIPYTGDVYWCESFPGLNGNKPKERYAIVISPPEKLPEPGGKYLVVPTSESTFSLHKIGLPNQQSNPQTRSGLPCRCDAVCDEFKFVTADVLTKWVGDMRTLMVSRLQEEVMTVVNKRRQEAELAHHRELRDRKKPDAD